MEKNRVKINMLNTEYVVLSDEDQDYVIKTANEVEKKIKSLKDGNTKISDTMAAILVAMDYCDELKRSNLLIENLKAQVKSCLDDSANSRNQFNEARDALESFKENSQNEIDMLKEEIRTLKEKLKVENKAENEVKSVSPPTPVLNTARNSSNLDEYMEKEENLENISDFEGDLKGFFDEDI